MFYTRRDSIEEDIVELENLDNDEIATSGMVGYVFNLVIIK
ncbi:hypothetical protein SJI19_04320 [Acerihabitans sp. TG2]|nr:hypothetical protein [Acerihabitans sp. TG2]MEA9389787.1 hypothetical protein [Acerihabitans sp. TG2]